jgi:hypothetical protein
MEGGSHTHPKLKAAMTTVCGTMQQARSHNRPIVSAD